MNWISIKSIKKSITVMGYKHKLADVDYLELLKQLRILACQLLTSDAPRYIKSR